MNIVNLIKNKNISLLTLIGTGDYSVLDTSLFEYKYGNVKTLSIGKFKIYAYILNSLKGNNDSCNMELRDLHIIDSSSDVSYKCNIMFIEMLSLYK